MCVGGGGTDVTWETGKVRYVDSFYFFYQCKIKAWSKFDRDEVTKMTNNTDKITLEITAKKYLTVVSMK